jgi:adenosylhomocysteine nucleosidase
LRFLVTFALENEFAPWRTATRFQAVKGATLPDVYGAQIRGADVTALLTGVGAKRAGRAAARLLRENERYDAVISSGLAGGLCEGIEVGQLAAAKGVTCEPLEANARGGYLQCSMALIDFAASCNAKIVEKFYTAGHAAATVEEKRRLSHSADVIEMESFDVLLAAKEEGIPAIAIRAISDVADEDLPLEMNGILNDEGRVSVARVLGQAAMHPAVWPRLVRLAQQSKQASENLADFLNTYIGLIAEKMSVLEARRPAIA